MDTDMAAHVDGPKADPAAVAGLALDGVEAGEFEVVADETSRGIKSALSGPVTEIYPLLTPASAR
jgi:hypothetical protein